MADTPSANVPNETRAGATPQAPFPSGAGVRSGDDDGQSRIPASPPFAALRCVPRRLTWCGADAMTMAYSALAEAAMIQRLRPTLSILLLWLALPVWAYDWLQFNGNP